MITRSSFVRPRSRFFIVSAAWREDPSGMLPFPPHIISNLELGIKCLKLNKIRVSERCVGVYRLMVIGSFRMSHNLLKPLPTKKETHEYC